MRIITVSREFGSGGREIGKRLADELGFVYYDREIIASIAAASNMDEGYVSNMLENGTVWDFPITYGHTFNLFVEPQTNLTKILVAERRVLLDIANKGEDCIIVGRNADEILHGFKPFNIFVYADMASKVARCRSREEDGSRLSEKEMRRRIEKIDASRKKRRQLICGSKWGDKENYQLCVNTTGHTIKNLVKPIAEYAKAWFEENS